MKSPQERVLHVKITAHDIASTGQRTFRCKISVQVSKRIVLLATIPDFHHLNPTRSSGCLLCCGSASCGRSRRGQNDRFGISPAKLKALAPRQGCRQGVREKPRRNGNQTVRPVTSHVLKLPPNLHTKAWLKTQGNDSSVSWTN